MCSSGQETARLWKARCTSVEKDVDANSDIDAQANPSCVHAYAFGHEDADAGVDMQSKVL